MGGTESAFLGIGHDEDWRSKNSNKQKMAVEAES